MRVLHVIKYFRPEFTGVGVWLEKLLPLLCDRGIDNDILVTTLRKGAPDRSDYVMRGYSVSYFNDRADQSLKISCKLALFFTIPLGQVRRCAFSNTLRPPVLESSCCKNNRKEGNSNSDFG